MSTSKHSSSKLDELTTLVAPSVIAFPDGRGGPKRR